MQWCGLNYNINGIRFSYGYGSGGTFIIPLSTHSSPHHDSSKTSDTTSHSHFGTSKSSHNGRSLTYNCPIRSGGVDYRQFNPCNDGLKINTITSLAFQTKGNNDAHILLQNNANDFDNKVVEMVIGGWSNTKSVIRNQQQGPPLCSYEGNILSGSSFRWFWVSWSSGCVKVGKGSTVGGSQIMQWCGLNYNINGIRFSYGYGSGGTFIIPLSTHSSSHHSSSHHDTSKSSKTSGTSEHSHSSSTKSRKYVTIDCDSLNFVYQVCNVPGAKSINNVRLKEQRSKSECKLNSSFGFDGNHIWVNKGCRGRFNVCYNS
ncbi:uncharacterized protein LOC127864551 [Dreissena polymorpha]|uniref:uncharacterized protein LOC127864551 n=1 Tax=Dreissena polymorpha TaxID=45954 RepID=UPI0022643200|nr:uncharacterized protein LOC127864551 [Dreissena polymorpha]